jgi:hypothetical protein
LSAAGLSLPQALAAKEAGVVRPGHEDRACIMIFNLEAPSHVDLRDMKPEAAAEYRGPFKPIRTKSPDIDISEILPLHAKVADKFSLTRVRIERNGTKGRVSFGSHDSGRNLPFGAYVDNIGLNGLMIVEGQNERGFYITADKVTAETTRRFHLKANVEGGILSQPILLHVRK